jgi:hypothetical protein
MMYWRIMLPALVTGVAGAVQREVPQRRELRLSSSAASRQTIRRGSFRSVRELTVAGYSRQKNYFRLEWRL